MSESKILEMDLESRDGLFVRDRSLMWDELSELMIESR